LMTQGTKNVPDYKYLSLRNHETGILVTGK
jgi:hypothetical protein